MLGRKVVISINKRSIVYSKVNVWRKKIIKSRQINLPEEVDWGKESFTKAFLYFKNKFKIQNIRILLSDDLSYYLKLYVPTNIQNDKERDFIYKKICYEIPEVFGDEEWDYRELNTSDKVGYKRAIVFAPVKRIYVDLADVTKRINLHVSAIEPVSFAKLRNSNPIIGLALKTDIKGKDERILNLRINN